MHVHMSLVPRDVQLHDSLLYFLSLSNQDQIDLDVAELGDLDVGDKVCGACLRLAHNFIPDLWWAPYVYPPHMTTCRTSCWT